MKTHIPQPARVLSRIVRPINYLFDWLYHSRYNPLYRSGTLAMVFLAVLIVTGLYLVFFYSVSQPHASLVDIQNQVWLGRWVRALHRYSTDAAMLAIIFHVLQLLIQAKTWGPRFLAWISGVILLGGIFLTAWSGYVLVWDRHGQLYATAGAELLSVIPVLREVLTQAFNGVSPVTPSFFFMNLFMHVALPLLLIFGLWIHTSRLSRAVWFPTKQITVGSISALIALSVVWPATLLPAGDLLALPGRMPLDLFYGFWIPMLNWSSPLAIFIFWLALTSLGLSIPFWWRPKASVARPKSMVDETLCSGCTQCIHDCPYEAILMKPREDGKRLIAQVVPDHCVSCGICTASCDDLAIGPPGRNGQDQTADALRFCSTHLSGQTTSKKTRRIVVASCSNNGRVTERLHKSLGTEADVVFYQVECCGALLSKTLETILEHADGIFILGCPARNCHNRDGLELLSGRLFARRVPFLSREIDRRRVWVGANSEAELKEVKTALLQFQQRFPLENAKAAYTDSAKLSLAQTIRLVLTTICLLAFLATFSQFPAGQDSPTSQVRVSGRLPSFTKQNCHAPTADEEKGIPLHMRRLEICDEQKLSYRVEIFVDGALSVAHELVGSDRADEQPLFLNLDLPITPGHHRVLAKVTRHNDSQIVTTFDQQLDIGAGRVTLFRYDSGTAAFVTVQ